MGTVTKLYPANAAENVDNVLEQAVGVFDHALILGWDKDGALQFRGDTGLGDAEAMYLVECFKHALLTAALED